MHHDLICTWLGLPAGCWPPDHYRLLGLQPGTTDAERVEDEVHRRLEIVRRYQLTHAEPATEAMNRLAQAFVCLTDPEARKAYDAQLARPALPEPPSSAAESGETAVALDGESPDVLDVVQTPTAAPPSLARLPAAVGPRRPPALTEMPAVPSELEPTSPDFSIPPFMLTPPNGTAVDPLTAAGLPDIPHAAPPRPPTLDATRTRGTNRRGWGTRRALYQRLARTRNLRHAWDEAGKYVGRASWKVSRPTEATELIRHLSAIREMLERYPPLLGEAGQPGYLVAALARQQVIVPTFQTLLSGQREALARDWQAGQKFLASQQESLRRQLQSKRRKNPWPRSVRVAGSFLRDHPELLLLVLCLAALALARSGPEEHGTSNAQQTTPAATAPERP